MAIPIIKKGDTAAAIPFTAPDAVVELLAVYQGATRRFADVAAGASLSIQFTAEETARFALGTFPLVFAAKFADGRVKTYPFTAKVKVTDSPGLVYQAEVVIPGEEPAPLDGVDELPQRHQADDVAAKVNEIIRKLGGGAAATALAICLSAFGAGVQTAPLGQIYNDAPVVTNVTFDGLAPADYATISNRAMSAVQPGEMAAAIAAIPRPDLTAATNYTDAATNNLRSKADLVYRNAIHNGIEKWTVQIQGVDAPQTAEWNDDFQQWFNQDPPVNGLGIKIAASGYILSTTGGEFPFALSGDSATASDGWFTYTLTPVRFAEDRLALVSEVPEAPTNIVEQIAAATNALAERFTAEIEDLIKASEEWNRPGEWDLDYYAIPTSPVFNDFTLETNDVTGVVVSNAVITEANSLAARIFSVSLDELSPSAPPAVTLSCSDAGATLEGSLLTATSNGVYTVRGTTADAVTRTAKVPLMQTAAKTVRKSYYVADTNATRDAVNNIMVAGLSDMGAGDWHEYWVTNSEAHGTFRAWQTITPWWAWPGRGCYSPWAVAPKVVVSAAHYGNYRTTGPWEVYDNAGQTNFTVVIGAWVTLVDWARANGYSAEETSVADMGDIKVAPIVQGYFPDNCLPYLADADELAAMFGDMEDVMAWFCPQGDAERYAGNTYPYAIPVKLYRRGVVTEDTPKLPYGTIGWVEPHQFSDYSAATVRADILPLIGTYDEKSWYRLRPGDSGRPVFIRIGFAQDIPISSAHGYGWGPSIPAAARIIRAYSLQVTGCLPKSLPH